MAATVPRAEEATAANPIAARVTLIANLLMGQVTNLDIPRIATVARDHTLTAPNPTAANRLVTPQDPDPTSPEAHTKAFTLLSTLDMPSTGPRM